MDGWLGDWTNGTQSTDISLGGWVDGWPGGWGAGQTEHRVRTYRWEEMGGGWTCRVCGGCMDERVAMWLDGWVGGNTEDEHIGEWVGSWVAV